MDNILDCLLYIRKVHNYCYYCGIHYENQQDLEDNCPGISEDLH